MTTEAVLRDWRFGQTQAERMCADILAIEGFASVDPQHPLGGPDGLKDILCRRGISTYVAAAYFPTTRPTFAQIKTKFKDDLAGVAANCADGFIFFTGQPLTVAERTELKQNVDPSTSVELFHLERLRVVLDSPAGCGIRLEYLRISMSHEEQLAFWSSANIGVAKKLDRIEALQMQTLQQMASDAEHLLMRTSTMVTNLRSELSSSFSPMPSAGSAPLFKSGYATPEIDVAQLLWIHRIVLSSARLPEALVGTLRTLHVTVKSLEPQSDIFTPPPPENVPALIRDWCADWRDDFDQLLNQSREAILERICRAYYDFLYIHPFNDGNGRMGRVLLDQMLRELLDRSLPESFVEARIDHQNALLRANSGDLKPLYDLMVGALS